MPVSPLASDSPAPAAPWVRGFVIPREGWLCLGLGSGLLAIALYKGINLLLLLASVMLCVWGLNFLLSRRCLSALSARRRFDGPIFAGTPVLLEVELSNTRPTLVMGLRIDDAHAGSGARWSLTHLGPHARAVLRQEVQLPLRGKQPWGALRASSGYPFGLVHRWIELSSGEEIIVLPRLGQLQRGRLRRFLSQAGLAYATARPQPLRPQARSQAEFHGLRAFRSGDSPRGIHWRTSARCGELMVRELEDLSSDDLVLVLDLHDPGGPDSAMLVEQGISLAASVCWEWSRQKGDRLLLAVAGREPQLLDGTTGHEHALRCLECLAVQQATPAASATALLDELRHRCGGRGLPNAPVLVLGFDPAPLADAIAQQFRRSAAALAFGAVGRLDFYSPPDGEPDARGLPEKGSRLAPRGDTGAAFPVSPSIVPSRSEATTQGPAPSGTDSEARRRQA